jgi:two-component system cell cycle response regulator
MVMSLPRMSRTLLAAATVTLALMAVDVTVGLPVPGGLQPIWKWHYEAIELTTAAVCLLRAIGEPRERLAWSFIALAITGSACGDFYWDIVLAHLSSIPYPSAADAFYLSFYPAAYVGLALLLRSRGGRFPASVWLDGAICALGIAAVAGALVFPVVIDTTGGAVMTVVTNIAYPIGDIVMLGMITCVVAVMGWRPGPVWGLLALGMLVWAVGDTVSLYQTANGSYQAGTWLDLCWPGALVLVAAASNRSARRVQRTSFIGWPTLIVPAGFGTGALGLAVYDHFSRIDTAALLLASATIALVIARLALTFTEYLRALALSQREAVSDPLTGLGNRRALAADLERALDEQGERTVVVLFDLDGFKSYNDTFGHPAGDALLEQVASALAHAGHGGRVYRMGGDEFCLVAPIGARDADEIARQSAEALVMRGELFEITSSYGTVVVPDETTSLVDAMRLADQRLYLHKGVGRRSQTGQAIDTLVRVMQERDSMLGEHGNDVADLAGELAAELSLTQLERAQVRQAATLHDVGKLAIPDAILDKPGPLDPGEWQFMRRHSEIGERILGESPSLAAIGALVRASHERWDGSGYPDGLAGDAIPIGARIVALCDAYHAMVTTRSYRERTSHEAAVAELRRCAGTQFDPDLVAPFLRVLERRRQRVADVLAA